jgi:hypothetical protein
MVSVPSLRRHPQRSAHCASAPVPEAALRKRALDNSSIRGNLLTRVLRGHLAECGMVFTSVIFFSIFKISADAIFTTVQEPPSSM